MNRFVDDKHFKRSLFLIVFPIGMAEWHRELDALRLEGAKNLKVELAPECFEVPEIGRCIPIVEANAKSPWSKLVEKHAWRVIGSHAFMVVQFLANDLDGHFNHFRLSVQRDVNLGTSADILPASDIFHIASS
ncbi:MAG: hypothetical protein N2C14_13310 [Planctomycetales bacterium]